MIHRMLTQLHSAGLVDQASAHCDIPCGIYDPGPALIAAVSVVRLMDIMKASKSSDPVALANFHARCVLRKEEEAEKAKAEIRIIWGDYFKGKLLEEYPQIHGIAHNIMLKGSACKQDVHREDGEALVSLINEFAEIFWKTKGVATYRAVCPYEPKLEVVYPDLKK